MEYDRIIDKVIKLKELVDRGLDGEFLYVLYKITTSY